LKNFVILENENLPYGSWKDIKYLLDYHVDDNSKLRKILYPLEVIEGYNDMIVKKCIKLVLRTITKRHN